MRFRILTGRSIGATLGTKTVSPSLLQTEAGGCGDGQYGVIIMEMRNVKSVVHH